MSQIGTKPITWGNSNFYTGHDEGRYKLTMHMNRSKPTIDVTTNSLYTHKSVLHAKIK